MAKLPYIMYIVRLVVPIPVGYIPCIGSVLLLAFRPDILSFLLPQGRPLDEGVCFFCLESSNATYTRARGVEGGGGGDFRCLLARKVKESTLRYIHMHNH